MTPPTAATQITVDLLSLTSASHAVVVAFFTAVYLHEFCSWNYAIRDELTQELPHRTGGVHAPFELVEEFIVRAETNVICRGAYS